MKYSIIYLFTLLALLSCKKKEKNENIVAHWSLDGNALDNSLYKLNGQFIGNPKIADGVLDGKALEFNGMEFVEIDIANQNSEHIKNLSSGSISLWFKADAWDVENSILPLLYYGGEEACNEKISGDNTGMVIQIGHGGMFPSKSLFFTHFDKSCAYPALCFDTNNETGNIEIGKWYHFVGIVGEDYNTGYLNGEELKNRHYNFKSDSTSVFFDDYLHHEKLWIGKSIWMNEEVYFNGLIDDVRIYNKPLNIDEVKDLYNSKN